MAFKIEGNRTSSTELATTISTTSSLPIIVNAYSFCAMTYNEGEITGASPAGLYIIGSFSGTTANDLVFAHGKIR